MGVGETRAVEDAGPYVTRDDTDSVGDGLPDVPAADSETRNKFPANTYSVVRIRRRFLLRCYNRAAEGVGPYSAATL